MKKIIKRIICIVLAIAITVVSFGSVTYASESVSYSAFYNVNSSDPISTPYNFDVTLNNFKVQSKSTLGNEKHFLTWDNSVDMFNYKVEIFAKVYIEYKNIKDEDGHDNVSISKDKLENAPWSETSLPMIHCVDVDANDCLSVVDFTDIKSSYKTITEGYRNYDSDLIKSVTTLFDLFLPDKYEEFANNYYEEIIYCIDHETTASYIRFSRVKYFARYVAKTSTTQLLQPDADGYYHYYFNFVPIDPNPNSTCKEDEKTITWSNKFNVGTHELYEFKSRKRLYLFVCCKYIDYLERTANKSPWKEVRYKTCLAGSYYICDSNGGLSSNSMEGINIGNPQNSSGGRLIYGGYESLGDSKYGNPEQNAKEKILSNFGIDNILCVPPDNLYLDTNLPIKKYGKIQTSEDNAALSDWLNNGVYSYDTVTVGKFIENDTQIINVKPTPSPTPDVSSSPDVTTAPPSSSPKPTPTPSRYPGTGDDYTDTNVHDDNSDMSDVVHWLKMIYNRLGKQLEEFKIINTVVDKLDDIISNQKKMIDSFSGSDDTGTDSDNNDVVKYLKKIYNVLIANMVTSAIKDVMDYVNSFVQDVGQGISDAADTVYETASNTFPLSVIFIPKLVFETLSHDPVTPNKKISFTKPANKICGVNIPEYKFEFQLDLKDFNDLAKICRNCIVIVFLFGMVNYTADVVRMINDTVGSD
ncbi:MAG: hypothetical protein MR384_00530 [Lachnospiraceae bacterium]|nr:hypothetical protein [Lachnospiraceae bacterium]